MFDFDTTTRYLVSRKGLIEAEIRSAVENLRWMQDNLNSIDAELVRMQRGGSQPLPQPTLSDPTMRVLLLTSE